MGAEGKKSMSDPTGTLGATLEPLNQLFLFFFNSWSTLSGYDLRLGNVEISCIG